MKHHSTVWKILLLLCFFVAGSVAFTSKAEAKYNTPKSLQKHLKKKDADGVKNVKVVNDILVVQTKDETFNGKYLGLAAVNDFADIMKYSKSSPLAKNGIAVTQIDSYQDSMGNESKNLSFLIYYNKATIDQINFKNYWQVLSGNPKVFLENASGYSILPAFNDGKKYIFKGVPGSMPYNNTDLIKNLVQTIRPDDGE